MFYFFVILNIFTSFSKYLDGIASKDTYASSQYTFLLMQLKRKPLQY